MNEINISKIAKEIVDKLQEGGMATTEIKQVVISIELTDGTKISKKVDAFNYAVFIDDSEDNEG